MKRSKNNTLQLVPVLAALSGFILAGPLKAQTFTVLHSFATTTAQNSKYLPINADGANPTAGLTVSGTTLFGTAYFGGTWGSGTVFKLNADGTSFQVLHNFTA